MASKKNKKAKSNTSKSSIKTNKSSINKCKITRSAKKKKTRPKIRKSFTTDDIIFNKSVAFNIKKKKASTKPKKHGLKNNTKSNKKPQKTIQPAKSSRKLKRCAALTAQVHNKSIADNYKKKSTKLLSVKQNEKKKRGDSCLSMTTDDLDIICDKLQDKSETIESDDEKTMQEDIITNSQITILTEEKEYLLSETNKLKLEISELKRSEEMVKLMNKLKMQKMEADNVSNLQQVNNDHKMEIDNMQLTIDNLNFQQKKLKSELEHQSKLYEQKLMVLESDIAAKIAVNEQLKMFQERVEKQLMEQTKITNQIMEELEDVRKNEYIRVPRNNNSVGSRCGNSVTGGWCSSWWGKNRPIENNMYQKLREGSTHDHDND